MDELIEKCLLTGEELSALKANLLNPDLVERTLLTKAIPIISEEMKKTERKEAGGEEQEIGEILEKSFGSPDEYKTFTEEVAEEIYLTVMKPRMDYLTEALIMLRPEVSEEIKRELVKASKWTKQAGDRWVGTPENTGGRINMSEVYYLVPKTFVDKLGKTTGIQGVD